MKTCRLLLPREEGQSIVECGCWMVFGVLFLGCSVSALGALLSFAVNPKDAYNPWLVAVGVGVFLVLLSVAGLFVRRYWSRIYARFFVKTPEDREVSRRDFR